MKRASLFVLPLLILIGCISVPPDVEAVRYLQALQSKDAPASKEVIVEGKRWTVAKMGVALLEPDSRAAFVSLAVARIQTGQWPEVSEIRVQDGAWTVRKAGDCMLLTASEGVKGSIRETVLTSDAYLAVDEKLIPTLAELESVLRGSQSGRMPVVPVISPK